VSFQKLKNNQNYIADVCVPKTPKWCSKNTIKQNILRILLRRGLFLSKNTKFTILYLTPFRQANLVSFQKLKNNQNYIADVCVPKTPKLQKLKNSKLKTPKLKGSSLMTTTTVPSGYKTELHMRSKSRPGTYWASSKPRTLHSFRWMTRACQPSATKFMNSYPRRKHGPGKKTKKDAILGPRKNTGPSTSTPCSDTKLPSA
jgi:hypothetical protein